MTAEFLDAGRGARLLIAWPPKKRKRWTEADVHPDTEAAYHGLLDRLLNLDFDLDPQADNDKVPHRLQLSPEAKNAWIAFYGEWAKEQARVEDEMAAAYSKLEGYAARFALIHHVVSHINVESDDRRPVGVKSIEAGATLARWFANEAFRIYTTSTESNANREARRLVEFLHARGGKATVKELRNASRRYPTAADAEAALQVLVTAGVAEWQTRPAGPKGGRPSKICCLIPLPTADETDETPSDDDDFGGGSPAGAPTKPQGTR